MSTSALRMASSIGSPLERSQYSRRLWTGVNEGRQTRMEDGGSRIVPCSLLLRTPWPGILPARDGDCRCSHKGGSAMKAALSMVFGLAVVLALVVKVRARD